MGALIAALAEFISPVVVVFFSIVSLIAFLLGALADPQGLMNTVVCACIDFIASLFPSTPENLKISNIIISVSNQMPAVGTGIIKDVLFTLSSIFALTLIIKIYKLLPFKFS